MIKLNRCLQRLGLWRGSLPMTYFLQDFAFLRVHKLADFQSPNLLNNVIPRKGKSEEQCSSSFNCDTTLLFEKYEKAHKNDFYGQEKLGLLPVMVLDCLRAGKVDLAIQYSDEYLKLNGGLLSLKESREKPKEEKVGSRAIVPAANWLTLRFMRLRELDSTNSAQTLEMEEITASYRLCLHMAKKYQGFEEMQEAIGDNFSNVAKEMAILDKFLLNNSSPENAKTSIGSHSL